MLLCNENYEIILIAITNLAYYVPCSNLRTCSLDNVKKLLFPCMLNPSCQSYSAEESCCRVEGGTSVW